MIMQAQEDMLNWESLELILEELEAAIDNNDQQKIRELLIKAIPEFKPQCDIKDILYSNKNNLNT